MIRHISRAHDQLEVAVDSDHLAAALAGSSKHFSGLAAHLESLVQPVEPERAGRSGVVVDANGSAEASCVWLFVWAGRWRAGCDGPAELVPELAQINWCIEARRSGRTRAVRHSFWNS